MKYVELWVEYGPLSTVMMISKLRELLGPLEEGYQQPSCLEID
jgi:hypothetical protein